MKRIDTARPVPLGSRHLHLHGDDAEADVVVTALRFEPLSKGGPRGPAVVGPATPSAAPGYVPGPILLRGVLCGVKIGINATGQFRVEPVPAPLAGVAVHVVKPPRVRGVTADLRGLLKRRPFLRSVVRLSSKVRLLTADLVAEGCRGLRPGPAGVFPLRFGRQPELPIFR